MLPLVGFKLLTEPGGQVIDGSDQGDTQLILSRAQGGDRRAMDELLTRFYADLRRVAARWFQKETPGHTLEPTALVNEAYLRLVNPSELKWRDRNHFLCIAGRVMREVLIDHARRRRAAKRGGEQVRVDLDPVGAVAEEPARRGVDFLALNEALEGLATLDKRKAQVVELRFFSGLSIKETAEFLKVSAKTVEADWYGARAWLRKQLAETRDEA